MSEYKVGPFTDTMHNAYNNVYIIIGSNIAR